MICDSLLTFPEEQKEIYYSLVSVRYLEYSLPVSTIVPYYTTELLVSVNLNYRAGTILKSTGTD